jgi:hypothetical protein
MNAGIGNKALRFHFWEFINWIFGTVEEARACLNQGTAMGLVVGGFGGGALVFNNIQGRSALHFIL